MRPAPWIIAGTCTGLLLGGGLWAAQRAADRPGTAPPPPLNEAQERERVERSNSEAVKKLQSLPTINDQKVFVAPAQATTRVDLDAQGPGTDTPGTDADNNGVWDDAQQRLQALVSVPVTLNQSTEMTKVLQKSLLAALKPGAQDISVQGVPEDVREEVTSLRREIRTLSRCRLMRGPGLEVIDTFKVARQALETSPARTHQMQQAWKMLDVPADANVTSAECPELRIAQNAEEKRWMEAQGREAQRRIEEGLDSPAGQTPQKQTPPPPRAP